MHAELAAPPAFKSDLLDLRELQLDRCCAAKDRNRHLEARAILIHFLHDPVERLKWTVCHAHLLANLEVDGGLWMLDAFMHLIKNAIDFALAQRHRLVALPEKTGDLRDILHKVIGFVSQLGVQ